MKKEYFVISSDFEVCEKCESKEKAIELALEFNSHLTEKEKNDHHYDVIKAFPDVDFENIPDYNSAEYI